MWLILTLTTLSQAHLLRVHRNSTAWWHLRCHRTTTWISPQIGLSPLEKSWWMSIDHISTSTSSVSRLSGMLPLDRESHETCRTPEEPFLFAHRERHWGSSLYLNLMKDLPTPLMNRRKMSHFFTILLWCWEDGSGNAWSAQEKLEVVADVLSCISVYSSVYLILLTYFWQGTVFRTASQRNVRLSHFGFRDFRKADVFS